MTAQPTGPAHGADTGSHEVIHLGGHAAVVVPLAGDPRPAESFPYGSPDLRRLRVGRYRVMYEINGDVVSIWHIARETSG